jgi:hypothetical protein
VVHQKSAFFKEHEIDRNAGQHGTGLEIARLFANAVVTGRILVRVIRRLGVQIPSDPFFFSGVFSIVSLHNFHGMSVFPAVPLCSLLSDRGRVEKTVCYGRYSFLTG